MDGQTDGRTDTQNFRGYNIIPATFWWRGIKSRKNILINKSIVFVRKKKSHTLVKTDKPHYCLGFGNTVNYTIV